MKAVYQAMIKTEIPGLEFFELSQDLCFLQNLEGEVVWANRRFLEWLGISEPQWPLPIVHIIPANSVIEWNEVVKKCINAPTQKRSFAFLSDSKGLQSAYWAFKPHDDLIFALGTLPEATIEYQTLVNSYQHLAFLLDEKGALLAFNRAAIEALSELDATPLSVGLSFPLVLPEQERLSFAMLLQLGLSGKKKSITRKITFGEKGSRWLEISIGPLSDVDGATRRVLLTIVDITERKEKEERFKELQISYRSVFRQLAAGILLYDLDLNLIEVNQGLSELLGYTAAEVVDRDPFAFTHPDDKASSREWALKLVNGELEHYSVEKRYIHKNGHVLWCMLTATVVSDMHGKPKNIISVIQDISKQKKTEEDLRFKKNELDAFVHRASHDLKGPVNSLLALYDVVVSELAGQDLALQYFGHYHKNIQRLHDIIQNLLELSRIKDIKAHFKPVDVRQVVEAAKELLEHLPNYSNIQFRQEYEVPDRVMSDNTLLSTIVQNLIENAIKYSQPLRPGNVLIRVVLKDDMLTIQVQDNGIGIKEEVVSKVFNMFYRATDQASGSGLGLYLLKNAVDKLEGSIDIDSRYGEGTTFTIFLPNITEAVVSE